MLAAAVFIAVSPVAQAAAATKTSAGAARAPVKATYVGKVRGTNAYIAVLQDGRKIGGYVCDNGSLSKWMKYRWLRNGQAPLVAGTSGELLGRVRISGGRATGTVKVDGRQRQFTAVRTPASKGGLHFAIGKQPDRLLVAGWILHPDGTQRGAISAVNTRTLQPVAPRRAPRLSPKASEVPIGEPGLPPVVSEPQQLVVINIIAILIGLLLPAVQ